MSTSAQARSLLRWSAALMVAGAVHVGAAAITFNWRAAAAAPSAAPPSVMIELAPLTAPQTTNLDLAPGPQEADSMLRRESNAPEKAVETSNETILPLPQKQQAVALIEPPMPQPKPPAHETPRHEKTERSAPERRAVASRSAAPAAFDAQRSAQASAPASGAASISSAAAASWKSELMAQLNHYKRYPSGTDRAGTAFVAFNLNRSGEVTSARLTRSSGDSALDQEAVSLPRRASPLPPPPAGLGGRSIALTVPVHFDR